MIDINGMAHIVLTVRKWEEAKAFYGRLLPEMGMKKVFDGDAFFYHVGARTAIALSRSQNDDADEGFDQQRVGLHHFCLRAKSREDVDRTAALAEELGASMVRGPMDGDWAPGYYYVLFEDPDGIRFEVNYVPGQGVLKEGLGEIKPTGYR